VSEDNFRYSGARLLSFLCEHLPNENGRKFRSQLLNTYVLVVVDDDDVDD